MEKNGGILFLFFFLNIYITILAASEPLPHPILCQTGNFSCTSCWRAAGGCGIESEKQTTDQSHPLMTCKAFPQNGEFLFPNFMQLRFLLFAHWLCTTSLLLGQTEHAADMRGQGLWQEALLRILQRQSVTELPTQCRCSQGFLQNSEEQTEVLVGKQEACTYLRGEKFLVISLSADFWSIAAGRLLTYNSLEDGRPLRQNTHGKKLGSLSTPLSRCSQLPISSASHLLSSPVLSLTHVIRASWSFDLGSL